MCPAEFRIAAYKWQVGDTVKRGIHESVKINNIVLEIRSSLKPAYDTSFGECACAMLPPLLDESWTTKGFDSAMGKWKQLLAPFIVDQEVQIDLVYELTDYCSSRPVLYKPVVV